jgi:hypothetical protein
MSTDTSISTVPMVEPPWRESTTGSGYCMWENLPNDIMSQLQKVDRFGTDIGGFHYNVKRNDNGSFIVFRNTVEKYQENRRQFFRNSVYRVVEVQALPIEQANQLLATEKGVELIGSDPVKVLNGQMYLIIGRKKWLGKETDSQ